MDDTGERVILVTGGNSGIGRGIAVYFAQRGYRAAIFGRNGETLNATAEEIGVNCLALQVDVSQREQVVAAVGSVVEKWGRIDVLVNNAGIHSRILTSMPIEDAERLFRETIDTNLIGSFLMVMAAAPHLTRPGGRIINISSIGAFRGGRLAGQPAYVAAKSGLHGLTHSWAREFGPEGITVNGIAPGLVNTPMTADWPQEAIDGGLSEILVGRSGEPVDIAAAAYYLASPEASFVTGEIINVNGGGLIVH